MQLIQKQLPKNHKIYMFSDLHEGSLMKHHNGVKQMIDKILSEKNSYAICGGDIVEGILVDDKRYDPTTVDPNSSSMLMQYQNAVKELMPIKDRLLGVLEGNHDSKMASRGAGDFVRDSLCRELDVPYGTYTAIFSVKDNKGKTQYKIFYTHGARSLSSNAKDPIQREANMKATLKNRLSPLMGDCDVMACGHTHQLFVVEPHTALYLASDGSQITSRYLSNPENTTFIHPDHRWYLNTGSFLKLYGPMGISGYAERGGYSPVETGYAVIHVEDYKIVNCEKVVI